MTVYTFDGTMDGLLTAVFDAFALRREFALIPCDVLLLAEGDTLPLFCNHIHRVTTDEGKARRVWAGLEQRLSREAMKLISVSWLSELRELNQPLFRYICKVFAHGDIARNVADPDVLAVTNIARRVLHEQLRMKQFIRFQKAKDGTYLAVAAPDHNVLPLITDHFLDRFNDQPWLIYDAKRHYGYYYSLTPGPSPKGEGSHAAELPSHLRGGAGGEVIRVTFENELAVPFDLRNGKLDADVLSSDDQLLQDLWRTYFKAICIMERMNPHKQLKDMPRRYWKYLTEKQSSQKH